MALSEEHPSLPRYTEVAAAPDELPLFLPRYIRVPKGNGHGPFKYTELDLPLTRHPDLDPPTRQPLRAPTLYLREREEDLNDTERAIFANFWRFIREDDVEHVEDMVADGIISPHAVDRDGWTPLLCAVYCGHMAVIRRLVFLGADVNEFASADWERAQRTQRTPLQLAAAKGNLPAVRFLIEECGADDALIAPDGQLALRLAAENGHGEVVAYLPSRRGGGMRRWKAQHAKSLQSARKAGRKIGKWLRVILYDVPFTLFIWAPYKAGAYFWRHKKNIACVAANTIGRIPRYAYRAIKKLPGAVASLVSWLWRKAKQAPGKIWWVARILGAWLAKSVLRLGRAVADVFGRLFSVLHTVIAAMFRFMKDLMMKDVWNGFCALVRAVFVNFPVAVVKGIAALGKASYQVVKAPLGTFGAVAWWILVALFHIIMYVPWQMWRIAEAFGRSVAKAFREIMVWYNPKASW